MKENYPKAYTELTEIFRHLSSDDLNRIPEDVRENLERMKDPAYKFHLDLSKALVDQELLPETRAMLAEIYKLYLAPEEEREKYVQYCRKMNEKKKLEQYKRLQEREKEGGSYVS